MQYRLFIAGLTLFTLSACAPSVPKYKDPIGERYELTPPQGWTAHRSNNLNYPDGEMKGVSFIAPSNVGSGTVLDEARIDVATGKESFCPQTGSAAILGGQKANRWTWDDAAAGNRYQGTVVGTLHGGECYRLALFTHGCNLGADCARGHTAPFDPASLLPTFDQVAASFRFLK